MARNQGFANINVDLMSDIARTVLRALGGEFGEGS